MKSSLSSTTAATSVDKKHRFKKGISSNLCRSALTYLCHHKMFHGRVQKSASSVVGGRVSFGTVSSLESRKTKPKRYFAGCIYNHHLESQVPYFKAIVAGFRGKVA